jgi:hypothetical protein
MKNRLGGLSAIATVVGIGLCLLLGNSSSDAGAQQTAPVGPAAPAIPVAPATSTTPVAPVAPATSAPPVASGSAVTTAPATISAPTTTAPAPPAKASAAAAITTTKTPSSRSSSRTASAATTPSSSRATSTSSSSSPILRRRPEKPRRLRLVDPEAARRGDAPGGPAPAAGPAGRRRHLLDRAAVRAHRQQAAAQPRPHDRPPPQSLRVQQHRPRPGGVNLRFADDFPPDPYGYGFDNIGDVLSLSPMLTEKYMKAAEEVAQAAIPLAPPKVRLRGVRAGEDGPAPAGRCRDHPRLSRRRGLHPPLPVDGGRRQRRHHDRPLLSRWQRGLPPAHGDEAQPGDGDDVARDIPVTQGPHVFEGFMEVAPDSQQPARSRARCRCSS